MKNLPNLLLAVVLVAASAVLVAFFASQANGGNAADDTPVAAPYHERFGGQQAAPGEANGHNQPLPLAQDAASADTMAASGAVMIQAAEQMVSVVPTMLASDNQLVAELGQHWREDAEALRERGAWMTTSATSDSMIHDPARAHQLNLENLRANGMVMVVEGRAMAEHGREMVAQVEQLRADSVLATDVADDLIASGQALIDSGEAIERDGKAMRETAERLLKSLGR